MELTNQTKILLELDDLQAQHVAELFSVLGDSSRVKIIAALLSGPMNVQALADKVGISPSGISHHMRSLRQMQLVRSHKQGRQVFYSIEDQHVEELFQRGVDHVMHG
ncbi:ArsR/SmtB family transcription factor [Chloroflexota bacterium]